MADYNSSLPVRTENAGDIISKIADATTPSQQLAVGADGSINVTDNGGSLTVDGAVTVSATDLDIRDLSHTQDSVKVGDGTDFLAVNADGSVNVTDNGGSLTVDATDLDIRDLVFATDKVDVSGSSVTVSATDLDIRDLSASQDNVAISDGTDTLEVNADGSLNITDNGGSLTVDATDLDIRDLAFATDKVDVSGSSVTVSGSVTVTATDLDIRDLSHTQDSIKIGDGTDFLAVNADGSINVALASTPAGDEINDYNTAASIAAGATSNHDYTVSVGKTLELGSIWASASSKLKIEVQIETGSGTGVFNTKFVGFNSTANPNIAIEVKSPIAVVTGARVRIIRTNKDNQAQDLYSTISGQEI